MKKVISTEAKPIKMWLDDLEETALAQAKNLANLPFTFKHVALMPDCHAGYGLTIKSRQKMTLNKPNAVESPVDEYFAKKAKAMKERR